MIVRPSTNHRIELANRQVMTQRGACFHDSPKLAHEALNACVRRLINSLPLYLRTFMPRKSNPSSICVIRVFSNDSDNPRCPRNCSTIGLTSSASTSFVAPVTMKSSAYRTMLTFDELRTPLRNFARSVRSSPSRVSCRTQCVAPSSDYPCGVGEHPQSRQWVWPESHHCTCFEINSACTLASSDRPSASVRPSWSRLQSRRSTTAKTPSPSLIVSLSPPANLASMINRMAFSHRYDIDQRTPHETDAPQKA
jgi:hypothetical protein